MLRWFWPTELSRACSCSTAALFVVDLVIPDFIPFADEILLGLGTLLLANWKNRKARAPPDDRRDPRR